MPRQKINKPKINSRNSKNFQKKEAAFEEIKLKKDTLGEEDIGLLAEAVKAQEDYVVKKEF
jgi:NACalpha-BTF3-like transcription factor